MNNSRTRNKLYNFIVNTYGIGKDEVQKMVEERLDQVFSYNLTEKIESMIASRIEQEMKNTYVKEVKRYVSWYIQEKLEKEIKKTIKNMSFKSQIAIDFEPNVKIELKVDKT
jgi:membrane carboxypeptidase/penicillin-binding protein PbpC